MEEHEIQERMKIDIRNMSHEFVMIFYFMIAAATVRAL